MKSCREMRREAWGILRGKWFGRLLVVGVLLYAIAVTVNSLVSSAFVALSIDSLGTFAAHTLQAWRSGVVYTLPTFRAYVWMFSGFLFETFITYVFAAILAFGVCATLLKAYANDDRRWFADAFGGFSRPLEVTGLLALINLKALLWSVLFVIPGIVAAYRYRLAWFLKNEHPDWTARACIAESGRRMKGFKWKAFCLDISYLGWYFLLTAGMAASAILFGKAAECGAGAWPLSAVGFLVGALSCYLFLKVFLGQIVSRVVFYRELASREI